MRRLIHFTLCAFFLLGVTACGDDDESPEAQNDNNSNNSSNNSNNDDNNDNNDNNNDDNNNIPECTVGETRCDGEQIETCGADETWGAAEACAAGSCETTDAGGVCIEEEGPQAAAFVFSVDAASNRWIVTALATRSEGGILSTFDVPELSEITGAEADGGNGAGPSWGDAHASPDQTRIFVNATSANRLVVIDAINMAVERLIEVGERPVHLYNPNHVDQIWTHADGPGAFWIVDTLTLTVEDPLVAALAGAGHGKLMYDERLGDDYYATNTNDPGVFPIDGATLEVDDIINVCGQFPDDDPDTNDVDESTILQGGTHDKSYNPTMNWVIAQCLGGRGYSFVDASTNTVAHDQVPITGSMANSPDHRFTVVIDASTVNVWDTDAADHDGLAFDATFEVGGEPSARGVHFVQSAERQEAWIPQTAGTKVVVVDLATLDMRELEIGAVTRPEGAGHFSRYAALGGGHFMAYHDDGVVLIDLATDEIFDIGSFEGVPSRLVFTDPTQ